MRDFPGSLLRASDLDLSQMQRLFWQTYFYQSNYRPGVVFPDLSYSTVVLAFFEDSTRTRLSFELAARRLSATVLQFASAGSSISKGESLADTIRTIDAMLVDMYIVRSRYAGVPEFVGQLTGKQVINAGDGKHEHPTQALLDAYTLWQHFGKLEGLNISIVGDILHSRVARSNITALQTLGANVRLLSPGTLMPPHLNCWGLEMHESVEQAVLWSDAMIVLRMQNERMDSGYLPSVAEFVRFYQTNLPQFIKNDKLMLLHPGPANYGVELDHATARHHRSLIERQVTNGVFVRMAIMKTLSQAIVLGE